MPKVPDPKIADWVVALTRSGGEAGEVVKAHLPADAESAYLFGFEVGYRLGLADLPGLLGRRKSPAKAAASRANGRRGGRPRKDVTGSP